MGDVPGCNSIVKFTSPCGGNPDSSLGKTSSFVRQPLCMGVLGV